MSASEVLFLSLRYTNFLIIIIIIIIRQYHSDLSELSALEIRLDLTLHCISIFMENKENEHLIFREFHFT